MATALVLETPNGTTRRRLPQVESHDVAYFMEELMHKIYEFFDDQTLIDVTFKVSNPDALIPAHRIVLSAASPYFIDLFNSDKGITPLVEVNNIDSETFERLIGYCYTGKALITIENVDKILKAAIHLKLEDAVAKCTDFIIANINEYTLQRLYNLEGQIECALLQTKIADYEKNNFMEVCQSNEFLDFDYEKLLPILESNNLSVSCEADVFGAVKRWYEYDPSARQQHIVHLVNCLRLTQFDIDFLLTHIQALPGCELIALKASTWIGTPSTRSKVSLRFTKPRKGLSENWGDISLLAVISQTTRHDCTGPGYILQYNQPADEWQMHSDIHTDIARFGVVRWNDFLAFVGGFKNKIPTNHTNFWNLRTKTWRPGPTMLQQRYDLSVVNSNNKIYAIGGAGSDDNFLRSVEMYTASEWKYVCNMNTPRCRAGAVAFKGKIYVMGGYNGSDLKSVECYDPSMSCWTECADMNDVHDFPGAVVHKDQIYVLGGWSEKCNSSVERYDPQTNVWTKVCSLKTGRWGMGCVSIRNHLWAIGGFSNKDESNVSVYDQDYNEWFEKKPLPITGGYSCYALTLRVKQSE